MNRRIRYGGSACALALFLLATSTPGTASETATRLMQEYRNQGAQPFRAARGQSVWTGRHRDARTGQERSCTTCHTEDLRKPGKHTRTGKRIEPMAPSVNPKRLTDGGKIEKWFKRNCKWTLGRECTPQEKGDILTFLLTQ